MAHIAANNDTAGSKGFFKEARVLSVDAEQQSAQIYIDDVSGIQDLQARIALSHQCNLHQGDKVVVAGESIGTLFIVGILSQPPSKLSSDEGTYAVLDESRGQSVFRIYSKQDELLVEHDIAVRKTRITCSKGDLEFLAPKGNISLQSKGSIDFNSDSINIHSKKRFTVQSGDQFSDTHSLFSVSQNQIQMNGTNLQLTVKKAAFLMEDLLVTGKRVIGNLEHTRVTARNLETCAQTVISKAKNAYQSVEQLSQFKTGRLMTMVASTFHLKSKNSVLNSDADFKIRAKKINLG